MLNVLISLLNIRGYLYTLIQPDIIYLACTSRIIATNQRCCRCWLSGPDNYIKNQNNFIGGNVTSTVIIQGTFTLIIQWSLLFDSSWDHNYIALFIEILLGCAVTRDSTWVTWRRWLKLVLKVFNIYFVSHGFHSTFAEILDFWGKPPKIEYFSMLFPQDAYLVTTEVRIHGLMDIVDHIPLNLSHKIKLPPVRNLSKNFY